jgi:methionine sulfoxide reductase heme-binding subunit
MIAAGMPVAWLVARAAGLVAFGLLSVAVWLGLAMSTRLLAPRRQKELMGWHQTLLWTAVGMLVLHATAILLDPTLHFGVLATLVPGAAPWRPIAVSAGVTAGWFMVALAASFRLRRRIGQKRWRLLHYASFGAYACALGHGLTAGSDLVGVTGLVAAALSAAPVVWLSFARILMPRTPARPATKVPAVPA